MSRKHTMNHLHLCLAFFVGWLWVAPAAAQVSPGSQDSLALSLEEGVRRVAQQGEEVQTARAQVDAADARVGAARSAAFPQLNGNLGYTRTFASVFTSGGGGGFGDLPFSRQNSYSLGLNASQVLFAGGRIRSSIDAAQSGVEAAQANLTQAEAQTRLQVRDAYYQTLLAREMVTIADSALQQAERFLEEERLRFETGQTSELDVLNAEVELENLRPQLVQAHNAADAAALNLKRLVNIPLEQPLRLTTQLHLPPEEELAQPTLLPEARVLREATLRAAEAQVAVGEEQVDIEQSAYLPSISVNTSYGQQLYAADIFSFQGDWTPNWTAGLSISVPIFNGLQRRAQVGQAQAQLSTARLQRTQQEEAVQLQYQQALNEKERAATLIQARQRTVDQAQRVYELTVLRYEQGRTTQLAVSDARLSLLQARSNLVQALSDYYTAETVLIGPMEGAAVGEASATQQPGSGSQAGQQQPAGGSSIGLPIPGLGGGGLP